MKEGVGGGGGSGDLQKAFSRAFLVRTFVVGPGVWRRRGVEDLKNRNVRRTLIVNDPLPVTHHCFTEEGAPRSSLCCMPIPSLSVAFYSNIFLVSPPACRYHPTSALCLGFSGLTTKCGHFIMKAHEDKKQVWLLKSENNFLSNGTYLIRISIFRHYLAS